ncbi:MAG: Asp-tRNA(Asn)/Glu-tRNA(Gln) amidotransferase subunit GatC [Firmicutes bacterium]|nr:Asp-tRNA(Asn)/Glu-tRNA(Gln) amidotransferase subunit GatC [Bacillota bacterium]MBQ3199589.1 Asp-tRNA(Asn)/Glu-tRNA(Gln) amidotransferase subunit GatC [Bacillota bacterium]
MEIDAKMVEYVAELSKLRLSEDEKVLMQQDLTRVLQYMDILNSLDTSAVQPLTHVSGVENVLREDVAAGSFGRDKILQNAIAVEDGCFKVPQTVE